MYEKPRVNVKVEPRSTFTFTRGFSYITSILIYARKASSSLRPYARKNYATVEIHLESKTTADKRLRPRYFVAVKLSSWVTRFVGFYLLKLINYSCSSYPTRASYSGQVDEFRNENTAFKHGRVFNSVFIGFLNSST